MPLVPRMLIICHKSGIRPKFMIILDNLAYQFSYSCLTAFRGSTYECVKEVAVIVQFHI